MLPRLAPLVALLLLAADPADRLAPGPVELRASLRETTRRVERAEALEVATTRLQNAWAERLAAGATLTRRCEDPSAVSLLARMLAFGPAWRDASQAARAERDRLVEIAAAATVRPLVDSATSEEVDDLQRRVARQEARYLEAIAWQSVHGRLPRACTGPLAHAPGLADPTHGSPSLAVAVYVTDGVVCPGGNPTDGGVLIVDAPLCVQAEGDCTCEPEPALPGAVLGAPPTP